MPYKAPIGDHRQDAVLPVVVSCIRADTPRGVADSNDVHQELFSLFDFDVNVLIPQ